MRRGDSEIVRQWANDRITRQSSFRPNFISKKDHASWFQSILDQPEKNKVFICLGADRERVGIVRFSRIQGKTSWEIHFTVSPRLRGKGLAGPMIRKAVLKVRRVVPRAAFLARVKSQNFKSLRVLKSLGFQVATRKRKMRGELVLTLRNHTPIAAQNRKPDNRGRKSAARAAK
jgi:RimJ/RimL family protein N-acetyltransferase